MPRTMHMRGNWLHGIGNRAVRAAVAALSDARRTGYEQSSASGTSTGLNGTNRVRNSATLVTESNLVVNVVGNVTWMIRGNLRLALTAARSSAASGSISLASSRRRPKSTPSFATLRLAHGKT